MDDIESLKRRIREHPAFLGGPPDGTYWLDMMEVVIEIFPDVLDATADLMANVALTRPEKWPVYALADERHPLRHLRWKVMEALARKVPRDLPVPNAVDTWARDVAAGNIPRPPGRSGRPTKELRNVIIATTVNGIRDLDELPYESDERRSACSVVAERLGVSYGKVRTIWLRTRPRIKKAQRLGVIPPPRKRRRATGPT